MGTISLFSYIMYQIEKAGLTNRVDELDTKIKKKLSNSRTSMKCRGVVFPLVLRPWERPDGASPSDGEKLSERGDHSDWEDGNSEESEDSEESEESEVEDNMEDILKLT